MFLNSACFTELYICLKALGGSVIGLSSTLEKVFINPRRIEKYSEQLCAATMLVVA